ncbi:hypothetical protein LJC08_02585 [Methanimicrococcus sp. OttesenSCG-928-J09]|nr:hypothetical protein [Methanimicrococcus sp. OttesenSCG-928-J09]
MLLLTIASTACNYYCLLLLRSAVTAISLLLPSVPLATYRLPLTACCCHLLFAAYHLPLAAICTVCCLLLPTQILHLHSVSAQTAVAL